MKRSSKGFTLIELLVVIAIIGLLSTLAVVALNSARQRSRDAKRVADIRQIQTALELGFSEVGAYPLNTTAIDLGVTGSNMVRLCQISATAQAFENAAGTTTSTGAATPCAGTTYMGLVPSNPSPNGTAYNYSSNTGGSDYRITFTLESATGQLGSGPNCAKPSGITTTATAGCTAT